MAALKWDWPIKLTCWLIGASLTLPPLPAGGMRGISPANAQITPDNTLGAESSIVTPQGVQDLIEGGAARGSNLFHSFQEFNVNEGTQVYFSNPQGIMNILTRVTGNNISNIFGKLGVTGAANLYIINPNGIHFGPNASLDVAGAFVATTAEAILLGEKGLYSATKPETSVLLTVQPRALFSYNLNQGTIKTEATLEVKPGASLTLVGGNVDLDGAKLKAPSGAIEIGAVGVDIR